MIESDEDINEEFIVTVTTYDYICVWTGFCFRAQDYATRFKLWKSFKITMEKYEVFLTIAKFEKKIMKESRNIE